MVKWQKAGLLIAAAAALCAPAQCAFIEYNSRTEWQAKVSNEAVVNYEGPAPGGVLNHHTATGYSVGDTQIVGYQDVSTYWLQGVASSAAMPWWDWGTGAILRSLETNAYTKIVVTFKNAPTAAGLHLMTANEQGRPVSISVNNGELLTTAATALRPNASWWGITGTSAINSITLTVPLNTILMLDTVSSGVASTSTPGGEISDIPEPSTMLLCGGGLMAAGLLRRRRSGAR